MTILVDTSVWIRALAGREPFKNALAHSLDREEVLGHDFVLGELLIGDRGGRQAVVDAYSKLHWVPSIPHAEVIEFVRQRKLHGQGIGWIDAHLLASALVARVQFWTADAPLQRVARELGLAQVSV